jgi:hypothetical protein
MLRQIVRQHTWSAREGEEECGDGGGVASVVALPGLLVVAQSQRVHAEIVELLDQIRSRIDERGSGSAGGASDEG